MAEIKRTPDRVAGAENASRAIANVLNFALQNKMQEEQRRKAMEAIAQEQQFKQKLQSQEQQAAMERFQSDVAFRNVVDQRLREQQRNELDEQIRHNKEMEKFRGDELTNDAAKIKALNKLREAQAKKYENQGKVETLSKSIAERVNQLNALAPYIREGSESAKMRSNMIMQELIPLQSELDKVRAGGTIAPDINRKVYESQRKGFQNYIESNVIDPMIQGIDTNTEKTKNKIFKNAQNAQGLDSLATGAPADTTGKSLEEMTVDELIQELSK